MPALNETHDPALRSWVPGANPGEGDFPIQNLPFGIFTRRGTEEPARGGVAIGDFVLDLAAAHARTIFSGPAAEAANAASAPTLNALMALGPGHWSALRLALSRLLREGGDRSAAGALMVPISAVELHLPARIGNYTDFYASIYHATNIGRIFRPDDPLLPNYKWVPIGYHGRASSVIVSDTPVPRPQGQRKRPDEAVPDFGPSRLLDYELELGVFVGPGNRLGEPIPLERADEHIFGVCLVNDWSARDIQAWEYQPLGPFLSKSFATSISPWIVTAEALAPFRTRAYSRPDGDPAPLPYLSSALDAEAGGIDIELEVLLRTEAMARRGEAPHRLSRGNSRDLYWTVSQLLAHHTSNGCNLNPGDLIATGTISGAGKESWGSLMELTSRGREAIVLPGGETRGFLEDGDEVTIRGRCVREGFAPIGLGACRGVIRRVAATGE